ncbi:hypothetical protein BC629DRAFT_1437360 [Irpex lacteus]|nr:hypothetical protein BC629DRAFT_1437360 [Irpex lacteus]
MHNLQAVSSLNASEKIISLGAAHWSQGLLSLLYEAFRKASYLFLSAYCRCLRGGNDGAAVYQVLVLQGGASVAFAPMNMLRAYRNWVKSSHQSTSPFRLAPLRLNPSSTRNGSSAMATMSETTSDIQLREWTMRCCGEYSHVGKVYITQNPTYTNNHLAVLFIKGVRHGQKSKRGCATFQYYRHEHGDATYNLVEAKVIEDALEKGDLFDISGHRGNARAVDCYDSHQDYVFIQWGDEER